MSRLATPLSLIAIAGASLALAACGSSSSGGGASSTTTTAAAAGAQGARGTQGAAFQKFQDCLKDNGVTLPTRGQRPGGNGGGGNGYGPPAGGTSTDGAPPAGAGAGGGFANNPKFAAAMKACAKLRPQGLGAGRRGGPGGGRFQQQSIKAFTPYLNCLKAAGLDVKISDGFNALRNLKRDDPKVQAALKSCQSKIPARPQASSTAPSGTA
jgi:hypothetical protein